MGQQWEQIIDILTLRTTGSTKLSFLSGYPDNFRAFAYMTMMAASSKCTERQYKKITSKISISEGAVAASTAIKQMHQVLMEPEHLHRISEKALTLLTYILQPKELGFTRTQLYKLVSDEEMLPIEAPSFFGLTPESVCIPIPDEATQCAICRRPLRSMPSEHVCLKCLNSIDALLAHRLLPEFIPINVANFKHIDFNFPPVDIEGDLGEVGKYHIQKHGNLIRVAYGQAAKGTQLQLPIPEYQTAIRD